MSANTAKRKLPSPAARKLRKSCSLSTCTSPPGTCMHCTCDGRCGRHPAGLCGGRREGSGRGCKRQDCTRDERCLHSNRATCCHCRNLVSSSGRAKRPRVQIPSIIAQMAPQVMATHDELLEAELRAFLQDANLGGDLSLCEYNAWASRRQFCNLVVLVCGTQFNLHKYPMLLECNKLHKMALHDDCKLVGTVPVLELPTFPGGAEMFETLAIYCYTGEISFSLANFAPMYCAIEFLELRNDVRDSAKRFLNQHIRQGSDGFCGFLQIVNTAQILAQSVLVDICMTALVQQSETLDANALLQLFTLSSELFLELTQRVFSSKLQVSSTCVRTTSAIASEMCVQAKLAQLHRDAQRNLSSNSCNRILAQQCVHLLQGASVEAVEAEKEAANEKPLDFTMLFTEDKKFLKLMENDLLVSTTSPSSICFSFGTHTLSETFVV